MNTFMEHQWNDNWQASTKVLTEQCVPNATFFTHITSWHRSRVSAIRSERLTAWNVWIWLRIEITENMRYFEIINGKFIALRVSINRYLFIKRNPRDMGVYCISMYLARSHRKSQCSTKKMSPVALTRIELRVVQYISSLFTESLSIGRK